MPAPRRLAATLATVALVPGLAALPALTATSAGTANAAGSTAKPSLLRPADGVHRATITETEHGIPHVVAKDYESLGYGEGFATAKTSICNLADTVMTSRGQRSRYLGPSGRYDDGVTLDATNLQVD